MGREIERKFLIKGEQWRSLSHGGKYYCQGYIPTSQAGTTVRVRIIENQGYLTIKGPSVGNVRDEFEYMIPLTDAQDILHSLCERPYIEKTRHKILIDGLIWEIDEFLGDNLGLILAEVELLESNQTINLPPWVGSEVSQDHRYYNSNLAKHPYKYW